jgi:hypothetical protein
MALTAPCWHVPSQKQSASVLLSCATNHVFMVIISSICQAWNLTSDEPQAAVYLALAILLDTRLAAHTTLMLRSLLARLTGSLHHRASGTGHHPSSARAVGNNRDVESSGDQGTPSQQPLLGHRSGQQAVPEEGEAEDVDVQAEREAVQAEGPGPHHTVSRASCSLVLAYIHLVWMPSCQLPMGVCRRKHVLLVIAGVCMFPNVTPSLSAAHVYCLLHHLFATLLLLCCTLCKDNSTHAGCCTPCLSPRFPLLGCGGRHHQDLCPGCTCRGNGTTVPET